MCNALVWQQWYILHSDSWKNQSIVFFLSSNTFRRFSFSRARSSCHTRCLAQARENNLFAPANGMVGKSIIWIYNIWYMNRWIHRQLWYQIYYLFTYLSIDTVSSVTRSFWVWRGLSLVATFRPWETRCVPPQRIILNSCIDSSTCLAASLAGCSVQSMDNEASLQNRAT